MGKTIYISNATKCQLFAKVDKEENYFSKYIEPGTAITMTYLNEKSHGGFQPVYAGQSLRFDVHTFWKLAKSRTAYISIITEEGRVICDNLPRRLKNGVVVTAEGYIADLKNDDKDPWLDTNRVDHEPFTICEPTNYDCSRFGQ